MQLCCCVTATSDAESPQLQQATLPHKKMTTHTNAAGTAYFSTTDENGQTVYSFSADFDDVWTQNDEDAINADSAPSKL